MIKGTLQTTEVNWKLTDNKQGVFQDLVKLLAINDPKIEEYKLSWDTFCDFLTPKI